METLTYSLQNDQSNSQNYYTDVRIFCDEVMKQARITLGPVINDFIRYLKNYNLEEIREKEEYVLELLSFGILWHNYSQKALAVRFAPFITLAKMAEWRKKHQRVKPLIDLTRGFLMTLLMLPDKPKNDFVAIPTLEQTDHVCKWFEATGEFAEQAIRFVRWRAYWEIKSRKVQSENFSAINNFTQWFTERSIKALGKYTKNVESFLNAADNSYRWREDRIQCTRSRSEYHLNMVGAELMNRAFKHDFENTDKKVVLLPGCMRAKSASECEAIRVKEGLICQGCLSSCRVNQIREMGKKRNFDVYIIPHSSDLSRWSPRPGTPDKGVVASACVTTLVEGGWELKRYNVAAQCVLLDYCGCKKHWHKEGIPTKVNLREFKNILKN